MKSPLQFKQDLSQELQIVIIDCPYNTFSNPNAQKLFCKFIDMKLRGYLRILDAPLLTFKTKLQFR